MLTITAGTHTAARAGYTIAKNGSTKNNTLTITDGTVGAAYGGWTEGKNLIASTAVDETHPVAVNTGANAEAEGNKLSLSGGTIGANGKIAGGYIAKYTLHQSHLVSAGDAKTNKVNISGGTIGDNTAIYGGYAAGTGAASGAQVTLQDKATVGGNLYGGYTAGAGAASGATITLKGAASVAGDLYGGFSAGTGATTGNVVNLGDGTKEGRISFDETNKRPRVTSVTGTIYGGSDASNTTGNILNVNGNAAVGNIKNFAAVKFHYNQDTTSAAAPMLKITDGVATAFDWSTFDYTGGIPMSGKLTIMANAAGINVANYTGARDLVGASANSEITIDTGNHTASSKKIVIDGLTFRYAKVKPEANTIGTDEEDVWGGRSVRSNTTTHNVLTIDKDTEHRDAYGGWTAGKGTMRTAKKDSTENTVNLVDGKVRNLYGGFTASADASAAGSATKNTVNLSGGEATGTAYGGFISHTGAGDATGNAVAITGGTMKDVYGGYTNGTGQTTGNTVTIGDGTNALPTGTNIAGYLYGGNKTVDTDNKLVVNTAVSVKNIKHFEKISFNISHVSNATTPFLKLTDGVQTSGLDWDKVEVTGANDFVPSTYRTRLATLMHNDQGIDFTKAGVNTYNPIRAKNRESGDLEYTIDTDNPTVTAAKEVYVDGFRFRHNKGTDGKGAKHLASDGTVAAAYGVTVTVKDGAAQDNAAEISGGTVTGNAYGGALTAVAATKNAAGGSAHITGGSVGGNVYGGAITDAAASGNVTGSSVHVAGGTVGGDVYAAYTTGTGATTGNKVYLGDGQSAIAAGTRVTGTIYGGSGTDVTDNELQVQGAGVTAGSIAHSSKVHFALNDYVPDGANVLSLTQNTALPFATVTEPTYAELSGWLGDAMEKSAHLIKMQGSALTLNGYTPGNRLRRLGDIEYVFGTDNDAGTTTGSLDLSVYRWRHDTTDITGTVPYIFGGKAVRGAAGETLRNRLRLKAGAYVYTAIGGDTQTPSGMAQENTITIEAGAQITQSAIGGKTRGGLAEENTVIVTGGQVQGNVYSADSAGAATGNGVFVTGGAALHSASANRVEITDAVIAGDVTGSSGAQTDDNQILLPGATVTGDVVGGTSAGGTGNTLAIYPGQSAIHDFSGVQKLRFYLPNDARASYTPMLQLGVAAKDIRNLNIGVGFSGSAPVLHGNDVISLMKTLPGGTLLTDADIANQIEGTQGVTMRYQFALQKRGTDELVLTLIGAAMNDQTKSLVEPRCGATDFINRGADLLAASGISSAAKEGGRAEDDEKRGYQLWAAMSQGTMRAETGSYVTTNGYNLSVGWAKEGRLRAAKTLFTPFVEYGRGTYHTYLDDGTHGNGKISYLGAGLMGASNARTDAGRRRRCTAEEYEAAIAVMSLSGRSRPTTAKMPTMRRISTSERRGCSARVIH